MFSQRIQKYLTIAGLALFLTSCQRPATQTTPQFFPRQGLGSFGAITKKVSERFMWGVSSAGYQSEGNERNSQWYYWELAGKTKHRSGRSVDFYNRYEEDIILAKQMGANSFRVSVEWSRIEPHPGEFDEAQLAYYKNLVQTIRKHGLEPMVTLLHFTYPHWLDFDTDQDRLTGWEDPDTVDLYIRYVDKVARALSPDVNYWITFNEPNIWLPIAHLAGRTPPGRKSLFGFLRAGRNVLQAHGRAYDRLHGVHPGSMVSSNIFQFQYNPFARSPRSYANSANAMTQSTVEAFAESDWFMNAFETGEFAYESKPLFQAQHYQGGVQAKNSSTVRLLGKIDYVAFDYYYRFTKLSQIIHAHETWRMPIYPEGLYNVLMDYHRRFRKPIVIAENGLGTYNNQPRKDGWKRGDHIVQHVHHMQRAIQDGANVAGYYHWSITDNYEWGDFDSRFGLYRVEALNDPELKRIPTDGVAAYQAVIQNQGINAQLLESYPGPAPK